MIKSEMFFDIIENFEIVPYTQTKGMFNMHSISGQNKIRFFVNNINEPTIACFGHEKRMLNKKMILIEGECYAKANDIKTENIRNFYSDISQLGYDFVEVCSNSEYNFDYETALRQSDYLRPVGQFSMPITKIIDLTNELKYCTNWKRNLKKASRYDLVFEAIENIQLIDCEDFVSIYDKMLKRKSLNCPLTVEQVFALCKTGDFCLYFVSQNNDRIATLITHERLTHAGSLYSASNDEALRTSASYFMYKEYLNHLISKNFKTFDTEKLIPSTGSVNNVFLFKDGIYGKHIVLNGEWSWYKKQYYRPLMYFVKKYLMKKREL